MNPAYVRQIDEAIVHRMKPGHLVHHYLLASYAYYQLNQKPMTDDAFDLLCRRLLSALPTIEHQHKHLIEEESLLAGTGYAIKEEDYPFIVRQSVHSYTASIQNGSLLDALEPHLSPVGGIVARRGRRAAPAPDIAPPAPPPQRRRTRSSVVVLDTKPGPAVQLEEQAIPRLRRATRRSR